MAGGKRRFEESSRFPGSTSSIGVTHGGLAGDVLGASSSSARTGQTTTRSNLMGRSSSGGSSRTKGRIHQASVVEVLAQVERSAVGVCQVGGSGGAGGITDHQGGAHTVGTSTTRRTRECWWRPWTSRLWWAGASRHSAQGEPQISSGRLQRWRDATRSRRWTCVFGGSPESNFSAGRRAYGNPSSSSIYGSGIFTACQTPEDRSGSFQPALQPEERDVWEGG